MSWKGFKDIQATIIIDLTKTEEELKNNLHKDAARYLKKSLQYNLEFKESDEWEDFFPVYKRVAVKGRIVPLDLNKIDKKDIFLLVVKYESKVIGGVVINFEEGMPNMMINALDSNYYYTCAGYFIYWKMILWAKDKGFKKLSLGGYQINAIEKLDNINKFKEKWGGEVFKYYLYSKNPFYILGRKIIRNVHLIKRLRDGLKLLKYSAGIRIKKYGLVKFLKKCFNKVVYERNRITLFCCDLNNIKQIEPKIGVKFKKADSEDLRELVKIKDFVFEELAHERIDSGDDCFIFLKDNSIPHYSWVNYKEIDASEVSITLTLNRGEFCIFDCYTAKDFRGQGLYPSMLCKIMEYLKEKGFTKAFIYADSKNKASIRGIEKAGFIFVTNLKYMNIFGLKKKPTSEKILDSINKKTPD